MFPKLTAPLAKSIRTGEGILVYLTNVVLAVAAVLPNGLSWTHTALYLTILNGVNVVARTALKVSAVASPVLGGDPLAYDPIDPVLIAQAVGDVGQAVVDIKAGPATPVA